MNITKIDSMRDLILSICIPTYNRASVLRKSIESIVCQKEFDNQVELVISDNCSEDNTEQVVADYIKKYPNIRYYRNERNLGAETNVINVLNLANGKFLKLVNDYSLFNEGSLKNILHIVFRYKEENSVIFFADNRFKTDEEVIECRDIDDFISISSYYITWMSCFGIWKKDFDFLQRNLFKNFNFPHLNLLLSNLSIGRKSIISNYPLFTALPITSKGGYNLFEVFIKKYLTLLSKYVDDGKISLHVFKNEKKKLLFNFIFPWYCRTVIDRDKNYKFETTGFISYLISFFSFKDIVKIFLKILSYKVSNQRSKIVIRKLKFTTGLKSFILRKLTLLIYNIINSKTYADLAIDKSIKDFKSFGENSKLPTIKRIVNPQYISIGNNFYALNNLRIEAHDKYERQKFKPEIIIGNNVKMNTDIHIGCIDKIIIGNNVLLASYIYISDHSHGEISKDALILPPVLRPLISKGPVIIEDNVWIGEGSAILPGVTLGENCIVGANSVVTRSFPSNCVIAGNPAKILKHLI